ncbi:DNA primase [Ferroacidibacillus organovorans]|uniref:DNA primase n=1 Tax=Ferroacidibacillus organovorans TaxID=1765683 RepID=A0A853K9I8_9BACL|nr:DNA primase [Ferroacidibacillus organovorans]KYP81067.1 hypothetical protein AYJ22_09050 [Ferroacidibacillus organovorans]OAG93695.1 hypothetical protein AYW79_09310 [Ferroacidibacillus organovorans]
MRVPDEFLALLRDRINLVDVISEYVRLKRSGRSYVGLCPFHAERSPSFHVHPAKGFYHCFGCGAGGSAITFVMEMEQLPFVEAVRRLAEQARLPFPNEWLQAELGEGSDRSERLRALDLAAKFYNHIVMNHDAGMQGLTYLLGRNLSKKIIMDYQLGYAPQGEQTLVDFLQKRQVSREILLETNLAVERSGLLRDRFRHRVMYPIWDAQGRVVGFGARTLGGEEPKYLNTAETSLFQKGQLLYGFHRARRAIRKSGLVLLAEGYMDVLALHQAGVENAVAALGTALTSEQAVILKRIADEVVLLYDGDEAGQRAAARNLPILRQAGLAVRVARLPSGIDPDEYLKTRDASAFHVEVLDAAVSGLMFELHHLTRSHPNHLTSGRLAYVKDAEAILAKDESAVEREEALAYLAETYQSPIEALREDVSRLRRALETKGKRVQFMPGSSVSQAAPVKRLPLKHEVAADQLLLRMLSDRSVALRIAETFQGEFPLPEQSALQAYLVSFYGTHMEADAAAFLSSLDDPSAVNYAARLLSRTPELQKGNDEEAAVQDYLQCLERFRASPEIEHLENEIKASFARGDLEAMRAAQEELKRLRSQLA